MDSREREYIDNKYSDILQTIYYTTIEHDYNLGHNKDLFKQYDRNYIIIYRDIQDDKIKSRCITFHSELNDRLSEHYYTSDYNVNLIDVKVMNGVSDEVLYHIELQEFNEKETQDIEAIDLTKCSLKSAVWY
jgi:hypothetical protein